MTAYLDRKMKGGGIGDWTGVIFICNPPSVPMKYLQYYTNWSTKWQWIT
jgi:hypothetical protein